ncbi:hypothetical protein DYB28_006545 [Aphanomyces astaci]|uniref:PH domain-containing protein n=1 Tax=Aphanomyces astaci TaxID=112090 RepID=A0A3L6USF2_APHAT|nr:hypothetical protein DYB35_007609 [Aphanomyces astaci]RLN99342.1 hypothetical protein DYB28_006545 [Aphanomyces astaci]
MPPTTHHRKVTSFMSVQETRWVVTKTFKDRIWTLNKRTLTVSADERFKFNTYAVKQGIAWTGAPHGIQVETEEGKWLRAVANNKAQWAMWLQAFQNLNAPNDVPQTPAKVSFCEHVRVRTIPASDDEDDDMYTTNSSDEDDR